MSDFWLFSYGTLRQPEVQLANFGRRLEGREDALAGYALSTVEITDPDVIATSGSAQHPILTHTGDPADRITGMAFLVTARDLVAADAYEVSDYVRRLVRLESGAEAFVYVKASER